MAKQNPSLLPTVSLARDSDGRLYALNHHDVILGCKMAGSKTISKINAIIDSENYKSSADVLVSHVREIATNEFFNPITNL